MLQSGLHGRAGRCSRRPVPQELLDVPDVLEAHRFDHPGGTGGPGLLQGVLRKELGPSRVRICRWRRVPEPRARGNGLRRCSSLWVARQGVADDPGLCRIERQHGLDSLCRQGTDQRGQSPGQSLARHRGRRFHLSRMLQDCVFCGAGHRAPGGEVSQTLPEVHVVLEVARDFDDLGIEGRDRVQILLCQNSRPERIRIRGWRSRAHVGLRRELLDVVNFIQFYTLRMRCERWRSDV